MSDNRGIIETSMNRSEQEEYNNLYKTTVGGRVKLSNKQSDRMITDVEKLAKEYADKVYLWKEASRNLAEHESKSSRLKQEEAKANDDMVKCHAKLVELVAREGSQDAARENNR